MHNLGDVFGVGKFDALSRFVQIISRDFLLRPRGQDPRTELRGLSPFTLMQGLSRLEPRLQLPPAHIPHFRRSKTRIVTGYEQGIPSQLFAFPPSPWADDAPKTSKIPASCSSLKSSIQSPTSSVVKSTASLFLRAPDTRAE